MYLHLSLVDPYGRPLPHQALDQVEAGTNDVTQNEYTQHKIVLRGLIRRRGEPVILNVYEYFWITCTGQEYTLSTQHHGVFHSGIEVYGTQFAYEGHPFPYSGIYEISPRQIKYGGKFKFKLSIHLGNTDFTEEEIRHILTELGDEWRGDRYHAMNKNCNNFAEAIAWILIGQNEMPTWVNRLAYIVSSYTIIPKLFSNIYEVIYKLLL